MTRKSPSLPSWNLVVIIVRMITLILHYHNIKILSFPSPPSVGRRLAGRDAAGLPSGRFRVAGHAGSADGCWRRFQVACGRWVFAISWMCVRTFFLFFKLVPCIAVASRCGHVGLGPKVVAQRRGRVRFLENFRNFRYKFRRVASRSRRFWRQGRRVALEILRDAGCYFKSLRFREPPGGRGWAIFVPYLRGAPDILREYALSTPRDQLRRKDITNVNYGQGSDRTHYLGSRADTLPLLQLALGQTIKRKSIAETKMKMLSHQEESPLLMRAVWMPGTILVFDSVTLKLSSSMSLLIRFSHSELLKGVP